MNFFSKAVRWNFGFVLCLLGHVMPTPAWSDTSFTGATSSDWLTSSNWSEGLPVPGLAAEVSSASPVLSGGTGQTIGALSISSGRSVTIQEGASLSGEKLEVFSGSVVVSGSTTVVRFGANEDVRFGVGGSGSLTVAGGATFEVPSGTGSLVLGFSGGSGAINLNSGGILAAREVQRASTGAVSFDGGIFRATGTSLDVFQNFAEGNVSILANGGTMDTQNFALTVTGGIGGTGQLTKVGSGTLTLSGTSTYSGGTRVEDGLLIVASNGGLGNSAFAGAATAVGATAAVQINAGVSLSKSIAINSGASLDNRGTITSLLGVLSSGAGGGNLRNSGSITSSFADGVFIQDGAGNVTNTGGSIRGQSGNGILFRSGGVAINEAGGTINGTGLTGASGSSGVQFETSAATLQNLTGSTVTGSVYGVRLAAGGTVTNSGGSIIQTSGNGGRNGVFGQGASVTVNNLGNSTISGRQVGVLLTSGGLVVNEGTITGAQVVGASNAGVRFTNVAASLTNRGTINGGVSLSDHAHAVTLFSGSRINNNLSMGAHAGARLVLAGTGSQLYSSAVSGTTTFAGTLEKTGEGAWTIDRDFASIAGARAIEGVLRVNSVLAGSMLVESGATLGGTGRVSGAATIQGTLDPGQSPGTMAFGNNLTLDSSARVVMEIAGYTRGITYDAVNVFGTLRYGGILEVVFLDNFIPVGNDTFDFFDEFAAFEGQFSHITFSIPGYDGSFDPSTGVLTIAVIPEPSSAILLAFGFWLMLGLRSLRNRQKQAATSL